MLASISVDYYTRLEQGRERHPSRQVLDMLVETLGLDDDAREHLYGLAGLLPGTRIGRGPCMAHPDLVGLLESWPATPALVLSSTLDVLAGNTLALALFGGFAEQDNLARMLFLDPFARRFYVAWELAAESTVASLRAAARPDVEDRRLGALVRELAEGSEAFAALWLRQDVRAKRREVKRFDHPEVGPLALGFQTFDVCGAPGQQLVVYQPEVGSSSAQGLALLGSLVAERHVAPLA